MAFQSMIGDHWRVESKTVIEVARRAAGFSQRRLAEIARTQQSSVSEYESRRKSPTLEVVERLLDAANAELAVKPMVFLDVTGGSRDRRGSSCRTGCGRCRCPTCFARVQVLKYVFHTEGYERLGPVGSRANGSTSTSWSCNHGLEQMIAGCRSTGSC